MTNVFPSAFYYINLQKNLFLASGVSYEIRLREMSEFSRINFKFLREEHIDSTHIPYRICIVDTWNFFHFNMIYRKVLWVHTHIRHTQKKNHRVLYPDIICVPDKL